MTQEAPNFIEEQRMATIADWQTFLDVLSRSPKPPERPSLRQRPAPKAAAGERSGRARSRKS
jgi:hypothetical protein